MTTTLICGLCDTASIVPLGAIPERCPDCGGGLARVPRSRQCGECGEHLVVPAALCGWCAELARVAA